MNFKKYITMFAVTLALITATTASAKSRPAKIYAFGFAASFNDSTVYFTDIQEIDSAYITTKNNFLVSRENYSYQLRDYLSGIGEQHRTCTITYALDRKKIEKKYFSMRKKYISKGTFNVKYLNAPDFHFKPVTDVNTEDETLTPVKKVKDKKGKRKRGEMTPQEGHGNTPEGSGRPPQK